MSTPDSAVTLPAEWLADIRLRAEQGMELCLHEHTVHHSADDGTVWVTCDDPIEERTLDTFHLGPPTSQDRSDDIRHFVSSTLAKHAHRKAGDVVLTLLAALGF